MLFLLVAISVTVLIRYRWREDNWKSVVRSDGTGYYAYLPATVIYQDLQYRFYLDLKGKYGFGDLSENFLFTHNQKLYNRYFCGTSLVLLPFFLLALVCSALFGYDCDGHSFLFNCSVNIGALFYAITGLYFLCRFLLQYFKPRIVAVAIGSVFLGTNLFYYTLYESSYSHTYSFSFICIFIYLADRSIRIKTRKSFILLAACSAIIVLIRPTNGIVLLSIPFIAGSWEKCNEWIKALFRPVILVPTIFTGLAIVSIQSLLYFLQCGALWVDGYAYETFNFLQPEIINALFSYRAGVFVWSPVTIIAAIGLYGLGKKNRFALVSLVVFMFINLWIMSSWWAWHYEGTFGMRPMADYMAFFAILLCYTFSSFKKSFSRIIIYSLTLFMLFIAQVENYQKIREIIPYDKMTKDKFWYIFLKTNPKYCFDLSYPYHPKIPDQLKQISVKHFDFLPADKNSKLPEVYPNYLAEKSIEYSGFGDAEFIRLRLDKYQHPANYYVDLKLMTYYPSLYTSGEIRVSFYEKGQLLVYETMPIISPQFKVHEWNEVWQSFTTRVPMENADEVVIAFHNGTKYQVQLQQLEFTLASF